MTSLRSRLLATTGVTLWVFTALTWISLERAFRRTLRGAEERRLQGVIHAVLGAAELAPDGSFVLPEGELRVRELFVPLPSLAAAVVDEDDRVVWASPGYGRFDLLLPFGAPEGEWRFDEVPTALGGAFVLTLAVSWEREKMPERRFRAVAVTTLEPFSVQLAGFRSTLWHWMAGLSTALLLTLLVTLRYLLRPLGRATAQIGEVRAGTREELEGPFPAELDPLIRSLHDLLRHERAQRERHRHALDDLAHSLKTPLAVLKGESASKAAAEQIDRIDEIVTHRLRRASAGGAAFARPIPVRAAAERVADAVAKVHRDKPIRFDIAIPVEAVLRIDEGDLTELLGNLLDNAGRFCRGAVRVGGSFGEPETALEVEDDGPGFPEDRASELLRRGVRGDERHPGQGIGLAVVDDLARSYGASVRLDRSPRLGGAAVRISFRSGSAAVS